MANKKQKRDAQESRLEKKSKRIDAKFNALQGTLYSHANFYEYFRIFDKLASQFEGLKTYTERYNQLYGLTTTYGAVKTLVANSEQDPLLCKSVDALEEKYSRIIKIIMGETKLV